MKTKIPGYLISEELFRSKRTIIYRALREKDDTSVIIKTLNTGYPSNMEISRFKHEFHVTRKMDGEGVIHAYEEVKYANNLAMILVDIQGVSLREYLKQAERPDLEQLLRMAIVISLGLGHIHSQNVIHKDINPDNIIFNRETEILQIIDFNISTELSREQQDVNVANMLEGSVAYISPEQTGRMNRDLDYRTDYYSLGVTLYEMLTGNLPFEAEDILGWVYCHIARTVRSPHDLDPALPEVVSNIVLKLMAKGAEDRYQSSGGIVRDLEECLRQLEQNGHGEDFELGLDDISEKFQVPQQLFGREEELRTLLDSFERVVRGRAECLLVTGNSGIGKSALVHELYKPLTARRGYFISGKFDQLQRDIPYVAMAHAFDQLIQQLLTESEARMEVWREKLLAALSPNGQVIIDLVPALELVIGPQPAALELEGQLARNRLHLVFQNFIKVIAQPKRPLVIFIDDLQWADSGSLNLLEMLLSTFGLEHMLVIGAYRDNEVNEAHALMLMVKQVEDARVKVNRLSLGPLTEADVSHLLAATLHQQVSRVQPLACLVFDKTGGNPFFIQEFIKALHANGLLAFTSPQANGKGGGWQWELPQIEARSMTDNVVELMVAKVKQLPQQTQSSLQLAACMGNRFDLQTLALVSEKTPQAVATSLSEALQAELVVPLGDAYKYIAVFDEPEQFKLEYRFAHDRVQQAAYALIGPGKLQTAHWQMGQLLLAQILLEQQEEWIFDIVNHLNKGRVLLESRSEDEVDRRRLIELNLLAGQRAMTATAYGSALAYLEADLVLLPEDSWQTDYELTLQLYTLAAQVAYLHGAFDRITQFSETVLEQAHSPLDKAKIYEINIDFYESQGKLPEAVQTVVHALSLLGVNIHAEPDESDVERGIQKVRDALATLGPTLEIQLERLMDYPEMTNPVMVATLNILNRGQLASFYHNAKLHFLMQVAGIKLSVQYGLSPATPQLFGTYANHLCGKGDIETGYRIGRFVLELGERWDTFTSVTARSVINSLVRPWREHIRYTLEDLLVDHQATLESGDLFCAGALVQVYCTRSFMVGENLAKLEQEMAMYGSTLEQFEQVRTLETHQIYWQFVLNLRGQARIPWQLKGELFDTEIKQIQWLETRNIISLTAFYNSQCMLCYLFQRFPQAAEQATMAEPYLDAYTVGPYTPTFYLYDSLARLTIYCDVSATKQQEILARVDAHQARMKHWAEHAPMNFLHKYLLVEAERERVLGQDGQAREYYDQAIELAHEHEYIHEKALAYEVAARFYLAKGNLTIAYPYLREARYAYHRWGAAAKVKDLEGRYPKAFAPVTVTSETVTTDTGSHESSEMATGSSETGSTSKDGFMDWMSLVKASRSISGEIELRGLITNLMHVVLENAGADQAILLLDRSGKWFIETIAFFGNRETILESRRLDEISDRDVPLSIIHYIIRTQKDVILHNACVEGKFTDDPHIKQDQSKSALGLPIVFQGRLLGILILQNYKIKAVFTEERLQVLRTLVAQAATSLENVRVYEDLEQRVQFLTEELAIAKKEADEANQSKSVFLANMSHELRTPLNAIIGFSDILGSSIPDPKHKDYLDCISTSGGSLLTLINEILDLSKIESGKIELEYSPVSLTKMFNETKLLFEQKTYKKGVELILNISSAIPEALLLDGKRLRQILINLVGNAVKFTENGSITLTADCEYLDYQSKSVIKLNISVADTGVGIPESQQLNIFDAFEQVKGQSAEKYGGTGLELAITERIVETMGGSITLESVVGHGSTFIVEIKDVEVAAVLGLDTDQDRIFDFNAISFVPARMLIVDDIEYNRELLKTYLESYGFELDEAANGREAIENIRNQEPDLVLLDMKMPEMDGYEALAILKNDEHLKHIPIVAVTAFALKMDEERISKICDGYLSKPVKKGELIKEMMKYLPHTVKENKHTRYPGKVYGNEEIKKSITVLSPDLLEKILCTSELGDVASLSKLIARVSQSDAELAELLSGYAAEYKYEEIQKTLT
ncbi:MAG: AAA family ATPase [Planctomycetes bacterium]|nr:AAA family ATPase [Planctomycetota bacterium]